MTRRFFPTMTLTLGVVACSGGSPNQSAENHSVARISGAITLPNDPLFPEQWGLRNTGQLVLWTSFEGEQSFLVEGTPGVDINAPLAWDVTQGSSAIVVGVAELGDIDIQHEDLRDQILENDGETPGDGIDNDGNGCIDDDRGCDFINDDGLSFPVNHGTHVASVLAARIKNGKGIAGVAPKIKLLPLIASARDETFIEAIEYAEAMGVRVINGSQGGHVDWFNPAVRDAIAASDILFVFSGGNRGTPRFNFPSSYDLPNVISVANVTNTGELSDHSSYGSPHVDIAAPGRSIIGSFVGNEYDFLDGTSQAAPHVAGVAALLMKKFASLDAADVADRIARTRMRMTTLEGLVASDGMVDAAAALADVSSVELTASTAPGQITLSWSAAPGATRYEVERDGVIVNNGASTSHVHAGLAEDSGHIYRVRAFRGSRTQPWSHRLMAKASPMPLTRKVGLETPHPYPNDFSQSYTVTEPSAIRLRAHFSRLEALEGDALTYLRVFQDERESIDEALSGDYPEGFWTHWIEGNTFNFGFESDAEGVAFGFVLDRIEYFIEP